MWIAFTRIFEFFFLPFFSLGQKKNFFFLLKIQKCSRRDLQNLPTTVISCPFPIFVMM